MHGQFKLTKHLQERALHEESSATYGNRYHDTDCKVSLAERSGRCCKVPARQGERLTVAGVFRPYISNMVRDNPRDVGLKLIHGRCAILNHTYRVLTTPEQVQTIFRDSDRHFKATNNNSGYLFSQILGSCVGMISQDDWKRVRAIVEPAFSRDASKRYVSLIVGRTSQYMQELRTLPLISNGYIDPARDLKMLPFWVIAEIIYGQLSPKMEAELKSIARVREELYKYVIAGGLVRFAWSKYLPIAANKLLRSFRSQWLSFNERARVAAEERGAGHLPICSIYKAIEGKICTIPEILHTLDEILFANLDVTTGGLTWNLVQLAAHPDVQAVLRAEIAKVNSNAIGKEAAFEAYLSDPSTYLQCIILESSRLRPLIAFSIPQAAPSTRILDGYTFPAGTNFTVDSYSLNQRDRYWGADGLQFRPERFLDWKATEARYTFWRFGYGPRQCLGKYVADVIIRCVLVQISESYDLELDKEGLEWGRHEEVWIDHPNLKLRCRKRS